MKIKELVIVSIGMFLLSGPFKPLSACTGIRLLAEDGSVVYGRTMKWGSFDLNSRVAIVPRGYAFTGLTPDGPNGKKWEVKHGFVGLDMLEKDLIADGMNEKGLAAGLFTTPDLKALDFSKIEKGIMHLQLDKKKEQDVQDITPQN